MMDPHWLPELVIWNQEKEKWPEYQRRLFRIFHSEFGPGLQCTFRGERVGLRHYPLSGEFPEAFVHLTTSHQGDSSRSPDPLRCERIRWPRPVIEHFASCDVCAYKECTKPNVWRVRKRIKIYLPNQQYLVVLEKRNQNYWLLITAYYLKYTHSINKLLKEYHSQDPDIEIIQ